MSAADATAAAAAAGRPATRRRRWHRVPGSLRLGLGIYAFALVLAFVGEVALEDPNRQDLASALEPPGSPGHLLGTDVLGHDVLSWVAHSVVTSLVIGVCVVAISAVLGSMIGVVAGYVGGALDAVLMRVVDLQLAVPPLLLFICATSTLGHSMLTLILLISVVSWVPYARVVRTQVQLESTRASVAAARLAGVGRLRLLTVHLLPSAAAMILVLASLQMGFVLLWEASLSFIGLGIQPPRASLGFLIAQGRSSLQQAWWVVVFPGTMLALLLLAANVTGDGLQERLGVDVEMVER
ncbi:MAG TPA: ABC transporter permease [Conexibacter sp.]|jgi:peptide/nickel transport system permease protein|nr:ABC transporter permease [Conexibacter sp.]